MFNHFKRFVVLCLGLFSLSACGLAESGDDQPVLEVGAKVPEFVVKDAEGNEMTLSHFAGKKVYINVWASWCGPCKREMPELEKAYQEFKGKDDYVFVSLVSSKDEVYGNSQPADKDTATILSVAKEAGVTYPVLFDTKDSAKTAFGLRSFPTHIFINSDGTLGQFFMGATSQETLTKELEKLK